MLHFEPPFHIVLASPSNGYCRLLLALQTKAGVTKTITTVAYSSFCLQSS